MSNTLLGVIVGTVAGLLWVSVQAQYDANMAFCRIYEQHATDPMTKFTLKDHERYEYHCR